MTDAIDWFLYRSRTGRPVQTWGSWFVDPMYEPREHKDQHISAWYEYQRKERLKREAIRAEKLKALRREREAKAWPMEKQRRSNVDWHELLDGHEYANKQIQWERGATISAMRNAGLTYRKIGEAFGVSGSRASGIEARYLRLKSAHKGKSPAEKYFDLCSGDFMRLAPKGKKIAQGYLIEFSRPADKRRDWLIV